MFAQQQADGSYSTSVDIATPYQATAEALRTLRGEGSADSLELARQFLVSDLYGGTEYLARRAIASAELGGPSSAYTQQLLSHQAPDGGFGELPGYQSNALDTAFALEALFATSSFGPAATAAATFLRESQDPSGAWTDGTGEESVYITALALRSLWLFRNSVGATSGIAAARSWLLNQRTGSSWAEPFLTALALIAIQPTLLDTSGIQDSLDALRQLQLTDGSFEGDVYVTALALRALNVTAQGNPDSISIRARLLDGDSRLPISDANVTLTGFGSPPQIIVTSSSGAFAFDALTPDTYTVTVTRPGYGTVTATVSVSAGAQVDFGDIALLRSAGASTGVVRGIVATVDGMPVPEAIVELAGVGQAVTAADGSYLINDVQPGTYEVSAGAPGYVTVTNQLSVTAGGTSLFHPRLRTFDPTQSHAIFGTILDAASGAPITGAAVTITGGDEPLTGTTDGSGAYHVTLPSSGTYTVAVSRVGYDSVQATVHYVQGSLIEFSPRLYAQGTSPADANSAGVEGVIADAANLAPLAGAVVTVDDGLTVRSVQSGPDGSFRVGGFTRNDATITIARSGYHSPHFGIALAPLSTTDLGTLLLRSQDLAQLLANLVPASVDASTVLLDRQTLVASGTAIAVVTNSGYADVAAGAQVTAFYDMNHDAAFTENVDVALGVASMPSLAQGDAASIPIFVAGVASFRDQPISVVVDTANEVIELSESDNVALSNASCEIAPNAAVFKYYGINAGGVIAITGISNGTKYTVRALPAGQVLFTGTVNRLERLEHNISSAFKYYVVEGSARLSALGYAPNFPSDYRGAYFLTTPDGVSRYGREFVFTGISGNADGFVAFAREQAVITVRNRLGNVVLTSPVLQPGQPFGLNALRGGPPVLITSTGDIAVQSFSGNGATVVPPRESGATGDDNDDLGTRFLFATYQWPFAGGSGVVAVFNPGTTAARFTMRHIGGSAVYPDQIVAPGQFYLRRELSTAFYSLDVSEGEVVVWAGDMELGPTIADMGDDIFLNRGIHSQEFLVHSQTDGAHVMALSDRTQVTLNGAVVADLNEGQVHQIARGQLVRIHTSKPAIVFTLGGTCCQGFNDWAVHLDLAKSVSVEYPDLTAGYVRIIEKGPGQLSVVTRVGNGGLVATTGTPTLKVYSGDPTQGGALVGSAVLPSIAAGDFVDVSVIISPQQVGTQDIYVVVDADATLKECNEANNAISVPFRTETALGSIEVTTDAAVYGPNAESVLLSVSINSGSFPNAYTVQLRVLDLNGAEVISFAPAAIGTLASGQTATLDQVWNTSTTLSGTYVLQGILRRDDGTLVDEDIASFIIGIGQDAAASLRTTTDRPSYHTTDRVLIGDLVRNLTSNAILDGAVLSVRVLDAFAAQVFSQTVALGQLAPGAVREVPLTFSFTAIGQGQYTVLGELRDGIGTLLAADDAQYQVSEDQALSIIGSVVAEFATRIQGQPQSCTDTVTNRGTVAATGLQVRRTVARLDQDVLLSQSVATLDVAAGATQTLARSVDTEPMEGGDYACALEAFANDQWTALGNAIFSVTAEPLTASAGITTDRAVYETTDSVQLVAQVTSQVQYRTARGLAVTITVAAPDGSVAFTQILPLADLAPGATDTRQAIFSFADAAEGTYAVTSVVRTADGAVLATADAAYQVRKTLAEALSGIVTADHALLQQGAAQTCRDTVVNASIFATGAVSIRQVLERTDVPQQIGSTTGIVSLAGSTSETLVRVFSTQDLAIGDYACALETSIDGQWQRLASASFHVDPPPIRIDGTLSTGTRGRLLVLLDPVEPAPDLECAGVRSANLKATLTKTIGTDATVVVDLYDSAGVKVDSETAKLSTFGSAVNQGGGGSYADLLITGFTSNSLTVRLQYKNAPDLKLGPAYRVKATVQHSGSGGLLGGLGSILSPPPSEALDSGTIDTSCSPPMAENNVYGSFKVLALEREPVADPPPLPTPPIEEQTAFLEALLTAAGWSYTLTFDKDTFTAELRSGEYALYALFNESVKLDEQVQKELREAVYRGEGLLEAGSHDQRNNNLDDALGIRFIGKHSHTAGIGIAATDWTAAGSVNLTLADKVLRAELNGASVVATYPDAAAPNAAVTAHDFGDGRSVYAGFDLLAEATRAGAGSAYAQLILEALGHVQGGYQQPYAGQAIPLALTLDNDGIAVTGRVLLPLPAGATVVDLGGATFAGNTLTWTFDLAEGETAVFNAVIRLPDAGGPVSFVATVQTALPGGGFADHDQVTLTITAVDAPDFDDAQLLAASDPAFSQVTHWLDKAAISLAEHDYARMQFELTQASDQAASVAHPQVHALRRAIDQALYENGMKL